MASKKDQRSQDAGEGRNQRDGQADLSGKRPQGTARHLQFANWGGVIEFPTPAPHSHPAFIRAPDSPPFAPTSSSSVAWGRRHEVWRACVAARALVCLRVRVCVCALVHARPVR